jgi:hypothetical protein
MAFRIRNVNSTNSEPDLVDIDSTPSTKKISPPRFLHNANAGIEKYLIPDISKHEHVHVPVVPEKEQLIYDKLCKQWKLIKEKNPTDSSIHPLQSPDQNPH